MKTKPKTPPIHRWRRLPLSRRHRLPGKAGLYAVVSFGRVLYVGMSRDLNQRWTAKSSHRHHRYWLASIQPFCGLRYFETLAYVREEKRVIDRYCPPWNYSDVPWWAEQDNWVLGTIGAIGWMLWAKRKQAKKPSPLPLLDAIMIAGVVALVVWFAETTAGLWWPVVAEVLGSIFGV